MTKRAQPDASPERPSVSRSGDDTEAAAVPATDLNSTVTLSQEALAELLAQVKRAQGSRASEAAEPAEKAKASAAAEEGVGTERAERSEKNEEENEEEDEDDAG